MESQPQLYPILDTKSTVKNFEEKIKDLGRPTIFIGSSIEAKPIAEKIKSCFPPSEFLIEAWYDGIFGKTKSSGGELSNMEWLKNFTDIYDFAIFVFVPDDSITSQTRYAKGNDKPLHAAATRHNVVFEFGLFMGKIGVKKTFILYDEKVDDFVQDFFTDLIENLNDAVDSTTGDFKIELFKYSGDYAGFRSGKASAPYDNASIERAIAEIRNKIKVAFKDVDLGFLPATSLATGYFNNCINIFSEITYTIRNGLDYPEKWKDEKLKEQKLDPDEFKEIISKIKNAKVVCLKVVIPNELTGAIQSNILKVVSKEKFKNVVFPGANRPLTLACMKRSLEEHNESLIFYDIPTTMNSSIGAIEMLTEHTQIRELLNEKEIRNFKKALHHQIDQVKKIGKMNIDELVQIISLDDFLIETSQSVEKAS